MILDRKQSLEFLKEMKRNENRKPNKKEKELIKMIKEECYGELLGEILVKAYIKRKFNPDKVLIALIKRTYGHNVKLKDLIVLIETSEVCKSGR